MDSATDVSTVHFVGVGKYHALTQRVNALSSHVVQAQNNVLRGHNDRLARCWRQNVVSRHHQCACFELCFQGQRYVNRHLVAIEVSVVSGTNQWVQLDSLAFNQHRFECLNTQTVKRRCTV